MIPKSAEAVQALIMRAGIVVNVTRADRLRLEAIVADRSALHFTPTSASWLNAVEGFFSIITRRQIRRGVFKSVADLEDAIRRYIREHNRSSKPFVWTKPAHTILAKLKRLPVSSE